MTPYLFLAGGDAFLAGVAGFGLAGFCLVPLVSADARAGLISVSSIVRGAIGVVSRENRKPLSHEKRQWL
jgi:hypothetical protein